MISQAYTFDLFALDVGCSDKFSRRDWQPIDLKDRLVKWQTGLEYSGDHWQTLWLESHDSARSVTRFGDEAEVNRQKAAKLLALLQSTLGGTMFLYQGQEIGMKNLTADIPIEQYKDLETHALIKAQLAKGRPEEEVRGEVLLKARDHGRAPIPWRAASASNLYAGFSNSKPWSPMNTDTSICNVATQQDDPDSVLQYWQKRIKLRKQHADALVFGDFEPVQSTFNNDVVFAFWRIPISSMDGRSLMGAGASERAIGSREQPERTREVLVVLNLGNHEGVQFVLPPDREGKDMEYVVLDDTYWSSQQRNGVYMRSGDVLDLAAYQGRVLGSP